MTNSVVFSESANGSPAETGLFEPSAWEVAFVIPGWIPNAEGWVGVGGVSVGVDASFADIISKAEMVGAGALDVSHGKFGFYLEGLYMDLALGGQPQGRLLSSVNVGVEAILAEGYITYRFLETDDLWIDFLAGARYTDLSVSLGLGVNSTGVREISEEVSEEVADRTALFVAQEILKWLAGLLPPGIGAGPSAVVLDGSSSRSAEVISVVREQVDRGVGSQNSELGNRIANSPAVRSAISDYARTVAAEQVAIVQSAGLPPGIQDAIRKAVEKRLAAAKEKLAGIIESEINRLIPANEVGASLSWVDPFVGFRARYQIDDQWHFAFRGDVGGFGVSSDLTWSLFAAVGYQYSDRITVECGYRYLATDYRAGDFVYDLAIKGPFIGVAIQF